VLDRIPIDDRVRIVERSRGKWPLFQFQSLLNLDQSLSGLNASSRDAHDFYLAYWRLPNLDDAELQIPSEMVNGMARNAAGDQILQRIVAAIFQVVRLHIFFGAMPAKLACVVIARQHLLSKLIPRGLIGALREPKAWILNAGAQRVEFHFSKSGGWGLPYRALKILVMALSVGLPF
jgi:hypothetical protein